VPLKPKPATCHGCPLYDLGEGFVPAQGPTDAEILFLGEAPGEVESYSGIPFSGPSGAMLDRILHKVKLDRKQVRVANSIFQCRPPANRVNGWYTAAAAKHCAQYIDPVLQGKHKLVIPLGGSAIRRLLGLPLQVKGKSGIRVQDFHGQPMQDTEGRWIVPTFHPAFLLRKASLTGIVVWDLLRALTVLREGFQYDVPKLVIDPPVEWFESWVEAVLATVGTPDEPWVPIDVETEGKDPDEGRADLGEMLTIDHRSAKILRVNLACSVGEGVTVPFQGPYIPLLARVCASSLVKVCHNEPYDSRRLALNGCPMAEPVFDSMDMFHALQSDIPKGLGFIAPMASKAPAWKHLATAEPGQYGAMDGVQTLRVAYWVAQQLVKWGMWDVYERHMWLFRTRCLRPAEKVGLLVDKAGMELFHVELEQALVLLDAELQALYPENLLKLDPKNGLVSRPDYFDVVERVVSKAVKVCQACGAEEVSVKHRCKDKTLTPAVIEIVKGVARFFRRLPFNPDSWQQVLAYVKDKGHTPGRNKSKGESVDKKALARLVRETHDPFYSLNQERRQTAKIDSTYVQVAIARADAQNRLHAQYKEVPSTLRVSCVPLDTEILTLGGWKRHDELQIGEQVVGYDVGRDELRLTPLEAVHCGQEALGFIPFRNNHELANGVRCTAGHRWVVEGGVLRGFMKAEDISRRASRKLVLAPGQGLPSGPRSITPTEAAIVGWAITDGCVQETRNKKGHFLVVTLSKPKSIQALRATLRLVKHTEHTYKRADCRTGFVTTFYVGTATFTPLWKRVGRLDAFALSISHAARCAMWEAMMEADGSRTRGDERFGAQKQHVKDAFAALCVALGRRVAFKDRARPQKFTDFHIHRGKQLGARYSNWQRPARGAALEDVWCPQTGCGTWIMRSPSSHGKGHRGMGQIVITGNCVAPNLTNMAAGKTYEAEEVGKTYAKRFRGLVLAGPGCELMEADFSGIEAVLVGWFASDPQYIRKAHLGVHAWLTSIVLERPPKASWSPEEEGAYYQALKAKEKQLYEACKRVVHGSSYGLTPHGMVENYPNIFHTVKAAKEIQDTFFRAAPRVHQWQQRVQALAHRQGFLGGPGQHPFGYKHYFWAVREARRDNHGGWYEKMDGPDAKRAIAYFPQSTARGVLTEALLRLFDPEGENWIGDAFYGEPPLRAVIHDSGLFEYPVEQRQHLLHAVYTEMTKPILQLPCPLEWKLGDFLTVGVEMKAGPNWRDMEVVPPVELGVASDSKVLDEDDEEEDELLA
jgi:DNA polymerase